jgi:hypothetical protein
MEGEHVPAPAPAAPWSMTPCLKAGACARCRTAQQGDELLGRVMRLASVPHHAQTWWRAAPAWAVAAASRHSSSSWKALGCGAMLIGSALKAGIGGRRGDGAEIDGGLFH